MKKLDELENPDSCLNRAGLDEPIFVLRANDELAAGIVREWAYTYIASKGGIAKATIAQVKKYNEALDLAAKMHMFPRERGGL